MGSLEESVDLSSLLAQDPGLPRKNPTSSFWQSPAHPLAKTQSHELADTTDIAVIGSGITGAAVTKTLLEQGGNHRITVFEARDLCSGATGRNGGQLAINAAEHYLQVRDEVGAEMAGVIIRFNLSTIEKVKQIALQFGQPDPEMEEVTKLRIFKDEQLFHQVHEGVKALVSDHPDLDGVYTVKDAAACRMEFGIADAVGGLVHRAGSVWPYRVIAGVFQQMLSQFGVRCTIETNTPVLGVSYEPETDDKFPYVVRTDRGSVRTAQVAYCTNAYTGHLLPTLQGSLFPLKGTMTVQDLGVSRKPSEPLTSWGIHYKPFQSEDGTLADGLIYGIQNAKTGHYFFGGEKTSVPELLSTDDTCVADSSVHFLQSTVQDLFVPDHHGRTNKSKLIASWSGIMCFTSDGRPLVGCLPEEITSRKGSQEWLCAGYNGYGMPIAWLAGENLARMMQGKPVSEGFPDAYSITKQRFKEKLSLERSVKYVMES